MTFKVKDHYFKKAKKEQFLARSVYKLEEIDKKYKLIDRGMQIVDFGYAPGSWVQYVSKIIGETGLVVGVDIKPVNKKLMNIKNIKLFEKDIFDISDLSELEMSHKFEAILSDMAPNTTGIKSVDQDRSLNLVEMVFHLLPRFLRPGGDMVIKVFDSHGAQTFLKQSKNKFKSFHFFKPKSTRSISKEFFVIGKGYCE